MDGQDLKNVAIQPNFALTPLEEMYGENVRQLREIRKKLTPPMSWVSLVGSRFERVMCTVELPVHGFI
jgi:hypothetical protein